jgi:hypothetical protein
VERFTAILGGETGEHSTVELPFDARERFGRARAPVREAVNRTAFRTTVAVYGGRQFLGFRKELPDAAGIAIGDEVTIELELDDAPPTVEPPPELQRPPARPPEVNGRGLSPSAAKSTAGPRSWWQVSGSACTGCRGSGSSR